MTPFRDALVEEFKTRIESTDAPTVSDILEAIHGCCVATKIDDRNDIDWFSLMAEVWRCSFTLSLHFRISRTPSGELADICGSLACCFELPESLRIETGNVEDDTYPLAAVFDVIRNWPQYQIVAQLVLPFDWAVARCE